MKRNRRIIHKSSRPVFHSNEELEAYLLQKESEIRRELERKKQIQEECEKKRIEAYKREPKECSPDEYEIWPPHYEDNGKVMSNVHILGYNMKFTVPEGVEVIQMFAFQFSTELTKVTLPSTLKIIKEFAFSRTGLREIIIPHGVEVIEDCAFQKCECLERVQLPSSIKEIQNSVFSKCSSLKEINIPPNAIIEWDVFPKHLEKYHKYEMSWSEMRVYENWKKTHDNILEWREIRKGLSEEDFKKQVKQIDELERKGKYAKKNHSIVDIFLSLFEKMGLICQYLGIRSN